MAKFGFKNLFGKSDDFFDKEATIKEYFALVPPSERRKCETYDELYDEALKFVSKQSFKENTANQTNYFHEISAEEGAIAVAIGILAYFVAYEVDKNGSDIEEAIDKHLPKNYDTNNPYDIQGGGRHRVFGHDIFAFGLKKIPGATKINVNGELMRVTDLFGIGESDCISMWDLIWGFYGNLDSPLKGVFSCLSHTIVHFAKDLFTPDGIPLPFTSIFEKYELQNVFEGGIKNQILVKYKDSVYKKERKLGLELKASDFASMVVIEALIGMYGGYKKKRIDTDLVGFKKDAKLIAMGTCLALQMATILTSGQFVTEQQSHAPAGKVNALMCGAFMKLTVQEMWDIYKARHSINKTYKSGYMRGYNNGTE